jgi:predicted phosphohydrolase
MLKTTTKSNTKTVRVNFTLPLYLYTELKENLPERTMSKFVSNALEHCLKAMRSRKFVNKNFGSVTYKEKDPTAYLKEIDRLNEEKMARLFNA